MEQNCARTAQTIELLTVEQIEADSTMRVRHRHGSVVILISGIGFNCAHTAQTICSFFKTDRRPDLTVTAQTE